MGKNDHLTWGPLFKRKEVTFRLVVEVDELLARLWL